MLHTHLNDLQFLQQLDEMRIKEHFIKIQVLSFNEEKIIKEIQGI